LPLRRRARGGDRRGRDRRHPAGRQHARRGGHPRRRCALRGHGLHRRPPLPPLMRVLVIGSGGREHALVWKLRQSPRISALYCAPGNAGIAEEAECVPIAADDVKRLLRFAEERHVDLTVVGPELPLTLGLVDRFTAAGLSAFGPTAAAARLEGSKAFTKELLRHERVPTAFFGVFGHPDDAARSPPLRTTSAPWTATGGRTRAAWAPARRRPSSRPRSRTASCARSWSPWCAASPGRASATRASSTPGSWCRTATPRCSSSTYASAIRRRRRCSSACA